MQIYPLFQVIIWFSLLASIVTSLDPSLALQSPSEPFLEKKTSPANHVTYVESQLSISISKNWRRLSWSPNLHRNPDTTVVLLNWARLPNVISQASVYCGPLLRDVVERVFVWNNQPKIELSYETHFSNTGCTSEQIQIFNSPSNIYFQARFIGCAYSRSQYCFLQDDDYIIHPEVFRNVHASFLESTSIYHNPPPIMLLPSHEHLGTDLLHTSVRYSTSHDGHINTTFAWLGHGTLLRRSQASAFLHLLRRLGLSEEEMNMADNYFTILSARYPITWHTDTIKLRDVKAAPFTSGVEGHRRNWGHIERTMFYLNTLLRNGSLDDISSHFWPSASEAPTRIAPCMPDACTISTNILMIPLHFTTGHDWTPGIKVEDIQAERLKQLGHDGASWYKSYPLSNAVDSDMETAFRSIGFAVEGDMISLTLLKPDITNNGTKNDLDIVWLVDAGTASILDATIVEGSQDGYLWHSVEHSSLTCLPATLLPLPQDLFINTPFMLTSVDTNTEPRVATPPNPEATSKLTIPDASLLECSISMKAREVLRHVRVRLVRDKQKEWVIYEMWFRN